MGKVVGGAVCSLLSRERRRVCPKELPGPMVCVPDNLSSGCHAWQSVLSLELALV